MNKSAGGRILYQRYHALQRQDGKTSTGCSNQSLVMRSILDAGSQACENGTEPEANGGWCKAMEGWIMNAARREDAADGHARWGLKRSH